MLKCINGETSPRDVSQKFWDAKPGDLFYGPIDPGSDDEERGLPKLYKFVGLVEHAWQHYQWDNSRKTTAVELEEVESGDHVLFEAYDRLGFWSATKEFDMINSKVRELSRELNIWTQLQKTSYDAICKIGAESRVNKE